VKLKTQLIAEIGQAHDGSLGILHSYIDVLSETGVQTVKFQMHIADAESSPLEPFRIPFSYEDKSRQDYWRRMEFSKAQWKEIKQHCEEKNLEFLATPFSIAAVELLEELEVRRYKVGSGNISDLLLLDRIANTGKPIILSSGMSDWNELDQAIQYIQKFHNQISVLQCTTAYPCPPEHLNLTCIAEINRRYNLPAGFSDHSGTIAAGIAAVSLGAVILEFHVVFDKRMFGPDAKASLNIDEVKQLVEAITFTETAIASTCNKNSDQLTELKKNFGQSLSVNKNLYAGHRIIKEDLESKKPAGFGIPSSDFEKLLGKIVKHDLKNWSDVGL
jgi:N,N'-diacetyllegionaminate synthase